MKIGVQAGGLARVQPIGPHGSVQILQLRHLRRAGVAGGKLRRRAFQHDPHLIEFHHLRLGERADHGAHAWAMLDHALAFHPAQGVADGCAAHGQTLRHFGLPQPVTGTIGARLHGLKQARIGDVALGTFGIG